MEYHHTQTGTTIIVVLAIAIILTLAIALNTGTMDPPVFATLILLGAFLILFHSLTVQINNGLLECRFGMGLIHKRIPLDKIQQVKKITNHWCTGWGIRWMPGSGWLWNVSGFDAVELVLKNGKRFRIGTDEPEKLLRALENRLSQKP
ncbi:MAG TPA: hypothetical protein PKN24_08865 [bacterium]|nr:hypothetical protein [bacterium]